MRLPDELVASFTSMALNQLVNGWTYQENMDPEQASADARRRPDNPDVEMLVISRARDVITADVLWGRITADRRSVYVGDGGLYDIVELTQYPPVHANLPALARVTMKARR